MKLDLTKSRISPFNSEKNWNGRSKNPLLIFMKGVKFSRSWLMELDLTKSRISPFNSEKNWSG
ncbi:hypothetical protein, partial [Listeria rustica]|uniref:hypothetical protein n=1 Tax=Listeria rustica TaxID=2713503 RepID=UPI001C66D4DC